MTSDTAVGLFGDEKSTNEQRETLANGGVPIAVYGLGKMGLPLAAVYAERTTNVVGVDIDSEVVSLVNAGESPIEGEPGLSQLVRALVADGSLSAHDTPALAAEDASVHVIIVPTTLTEDNHPDLTTLQAAVESIAEGLAPGDIVIVESTVPPGTCQSMVRPLLAEQSGLEPDSFGVAFCPERTSSGRALRDIRGAYPKIVGGVDEESTRVARLIYDTISDNEVITVSDATTAEAVKVFEGLYRDVNIALANELGRVRDDLGIDVIEAIDAANTQPYCDLHQPGAGVGGHCIPYYPYFIFDRVKTSMPLAETARAVNDSMPSFIVEKLVQRLATRNITLSDARVAVLGLAYRPGIAETRASPAKPMIDEFRSRGASVVVVDPVLEDTDTDYSLTPLSNLDLQKLDAAILVTNHREFGTIEWADAASLICIDGRDAIGDLPAHHDLYTIGRGPRVE